MPVNYVVRLTVPSYYLNQYILVASPMRLCLPWQPPKNCNLFCRWLFFLCMSFVGKKAIYNNELSWNMLCGSRTTYHQKYFVAFAWEPFHEKFRDHTFEIINTFPSGWWLKNFIFRIRATKYYKYRADSNLASDQWETSLQSNDVSHQLGSNLNPEIAYE